MQKHHGVNPSAYSLLSCHVFHYFLAIDLASPWHSRIWTGVHSSRHGKLLVTTVRGANLQLTLNLRNLSFFSEFAALNNEKLHLISFLSAANSGPNLINFT